MRIKQIKVKDYKRFHDLTIDLGDNPKKIVALVGPNGCGKSSVFDAMLYINTRLFTIGEKGTRDYTYHSLKEEEQYNTNNIKILFDNNKTYDETLNARYEIREHNTIFSFRSPYRYNSELLVRESKAIPHIKLNAYGASSASDVDEKVEQNYSRLRTKYNNYLNTKDCTPSEAKAHIIGELNSAITNCLDLYIDNLGDIESNRGTIFFRKRDHSNSFSFNVLSAGEKEVIDILLDLYLRRDYYTDSIFIIDEPELHINTAIQRKLLIEINKLIGENCQLWIATHSIGFLRALKEDLKDECQIIEFPAENKWASEKYILEAIKSNSETWRSLFETAVDDLAYLIAPKRIIYCEGSDKPSRDNCERGFDAKVYNNIFNQKYPDTLFVSSGGNTELDKRSEIAISILSKVFPKIEIWVLKDRDMASGKYTSESDRLEYIDNNPINHRVLKRWEIENYLFDKEVIEAYCHKENRCFDLKNYSETVIDIINDDLKSKTTNIKILCGIVGSVSPNNFKINLSKYITEDMEVYKELEDVIFNNK